MIEPASFRYVSCALDVAVENDAWALDLRIWHWHCRQQRFCVWMRRVSIEFAYRRNFNNLAKIHNRNAIRDMLDDRQIMRNEQICQRKFLLKVL